MSFDGYTIWEFKTANFRVVVDAIDEHEPDLSWDEDGSIRRGLNNGQFVLFAVRAQCFGPDGVKLASDYLGNCVYERADEFRDHVGIKKQGPNIGSYFSDMVRAVCKEARQEMLRISSVRIRNR